MSKINYEELQESTKLLGLIGLENRDMIKKKYLTLSKKYHPDMKDGDSERFQAINKAYKVLNQYMDSFKFRFSKEEFQDQYPFAFNDDKNWVYKTI